MSLQPIGDYWPKIGLGHETSMAENKTKTLASQDEMFTIFVETRPR